MTRDQLLILVALAFVLLINVVTRLLKRRLGGEAPRTPETEVSGIPPPVRRPPPVVTPHRIPAAADTTPSRHAVPRMAARPRKRAPLGGLRSVRHGIVLMTILGPCRALEPPGPQT
ncbi:MAG TPA: hypothetical protein VLK82_12050 [Candidatus Tectomicrobia bacterium]|nr:hypothetical protein [Candidatus Tectomicrobia bacterium]